MAGEPEEALRLHEESLAAIVEGPKAERERLFVRTEIGLDQVELGRYAEAADALEKSLEELGRLHRRQTPLRADVLLGLGRARMGLGRPREAREPLEQADELWREWDPEGPWAREAALWLKRCGEELGSS
jgi:tetratricopeptide (TPR) repeat protein